MSHTSAPLHAAALLTAVVLTTSCATAPPGRSLLDPVTTAISGDEWKIVETGRHPLLAEGVTIRTWAVGETSPPTDVVVTLRSGQESHAVETVADLRRHLAGGITTPRQAYQYSFLLRQFEIDDDEVPGWLLTHYGGNPYESAGMARVHDLETWGLRTRNLETTGGGGFDAEDAARWKIDVVPIVIEVEDGYTISGPVIVVSPQTPWEFRVIEILERIDRDGTYSFLHVRELQRGPEDRPRFVRLPR